MTVPAGFDTVVHAPLRLQICALLSGVDEAEFALVRDRTGVSESVLSKHARQLEEAGYLRVRKALAGSRQRTWLSLTATGKQAFSGHVAALRALTTSAGLHDQPGIGEPDRAPSLPAPA